MIALRPYRPGDEAGMAAVYEQAVRVVGARDYSPAQVAVWIGSGDLAGRLGAKMADGRRCWIAADADEAVRGFIDLEADGHIDFLYVHPEQAGGGLAGRLLDALEDAARTSGLTRLYVEASEPARRFFLKRGYEVTARRDFEVAGTPIHNYAMERRL